MTDRARSTRGRPPAASRETLQDAAFELFLEQGYSGTTVEDITRRAGVSRNTFFNYFESKGDLFWVELDAALDHLMSALEGAVGTPFERVRSALLTVGERLGPGAVPFVLTQHSLIGSITDVQASAVTRFTRATAMIEGFLLAEGVASPRAFTYAMTAGVIAAAHAWASAGPTRGSLAHHLPAAVDPILAGFRSAHP